MLKIRAEKDFWAGTLYVLLAAAFLWFGRDFRFGTASRMGPGYFPVVLGWILFGFGVISVGRSFVKPGDAVGDIAWTKLAIITAAVVAFGVLIQAAGLAFALPVMVVLSALASSRSVYGFKSLLVLIALAVFCILVFVKGLGVPMPILGFWFDGVVPPSWQQ